MFIKSRQQIANDAADWWRVHRLHPRQSEEIRQRLEKIVALGPTPDPDQIDIATGNDQFTRLTCSECNQHVEKVLQVGDDTDNWEGTVWICKDCVKSGLDLF